MLSYVARPLSVPRLLAPSLALITSSIGRAAKGTAMAAPFSAPRTSFNGTITGRRAIGFADLSLADVKKVKDATGTTVNDVVLAVAGGALRSYLDARGELPSASLLATVPVSVREASHRSAGANKVSALFAKLYTDVEDPLERLELMAVANRNAKEHAKAVPADALQDWAEFAAPRTFGLAVRAYAGMRLAEKHPVVHNLVISNVPGPPMPIYFMGARLDALYPLGPVFHGAGLNVTVMSNNGRLHVGVIACGVDARRAPMPWRPGSPTSSSGCSPRSAELSRPGRQALAARGRPTGALTVLTASTNAGTNTSDWSTHAAWPAGMSWMVAPGMLLARRSWRAGGITLSSRPITTAVGTSILRSQGREWWRPSAASACPTAHGDVERNSASAQSWTSVSPSGSTAAPARRASRAAVRLRAMPREASIAASVAAWKARSRVLPRKWSVVAARISPPTISGCWRQTRWAITEPIE